jgi:hypothetical protein
MLDASMFDVAPIVSHIFHQSLHHEHSISNFKHISAYLLRNSRISDARK